VIATVVQKDRVLVVEDEPMVAEVVDRYLRHHGFDTMVVHDGPAALGALDGFMPDLVVLDLMLPGLDGFEVCRRVCADGETPVIILTARGQEEDKLLGLGLGADDYVTKPFSPRELVARVKVVLRRSKPAVPADPDRLRFGDLRISERTRTVEDARGDLKLTAREFDLLLFMARHAGQVFTRDQLMDSVWDFDFAGDTSTVTVHIRRLRSKLEVDPSRPRHIKTVWGVGYKFEP
jgi:DNA-binding response OmpR family regulator